MNSFQYFLPQLTGIPMVTTWELSELAEMKGRQELYTKQSPQRLLKMREFSIIESAVSSNRIEGVRIDEKRIGAVFGNHILHDRNEEEVRGYRNALELIHTQSGQLTLSLDTIRQLHALIRPNIWDSGKFKEKSGDIIETFADGSSRVRFKTVEPDQVEQYLQTAIEKYQEVLRENRLSPLIALAAFNLDFLCIHPFRDGNGRVSRLLLLLMLYQLGYEAGRYISLEKLIENSQERYYETLEQSSQSWHAGKHDAWPYINYLLFTFKELYQTFETRFASTQPPRQSERQYVSGETFYLWGQKYYLVVNYSNRGNHLILMGDRAFLTVREASTPKQREHFVNEWYREVLGIEIEKRLPELEKNSGLFCDSWQIKYMTTRWGTCNTSTKKIWLNLQLAKKPLCCLEYIITHELVHLRVREHSERFTALMDQLMPSWREVRNQLNEQIPDYMEEPLTQDK